MNLSHKKSNNIYINNDEVMLGLISMSWLPDEAALKRHYHATKDLFLQEMQPKRIIHLFKLRFTCFLKRLSTKGAAMDSSCS